MVHLTEEQKYTIYCIQKQGYKQKEIAKAITEDKYRNTNNRGT